MIKHQMGICVCGQMKRVKFKTDQRKQIIGYDGGSVEYVRRVSTCSKSTFSLDNWVWVWVVLFNEIEYNSRTNKTTRRRLISQTLLEIIVINSTSATN